LVAESLAPIQQAQLLLVAGFVMLGWVLARRQIKSRRQLNQNARVANKAVKAIRDYKDPAVPLAGAPVETQRWQAAMFDLQRELKADLDTRIVIVQTLLQQVDQRIDRLENLQRALRQPNQKSAS
jgi:NAD dependent epimerase/dehydratase family enzyme